MTGYFFYLDLMHSQYKSSFLSLLLTNWFGEPAGHGLRNEELPCMKKGDDDEDGYGEVEMYERRA